MFSGRVVYILGSLQLQLGVTGIVPVYAIPLQNKTGSCPVLVRSGLLPSPVIFREDSSEELALETSRRFEKRLSLCCPKPRLSNLTLGSLTRHTPRSPSGSLLPKRWRAAQGAISQLPTFKGVWRSSAYFVQVRVMHTTSGQYPGHHRPSDDNPVTHRLGTTPACPPPTAPS